MKKPFFDEDISHHIQIDQERNLAYLPISTSLTLKQRRQFYNMPMDNENLTLDGLIDTVALTSAIAEQDLNKSKLIANEAKKDTGPPPNFRIMVANGQSEVQITPEQIKIKHIQPVDPAMLSIMIQHEVTTEIYTN